jgi:hypothetical protein
MAFTEHLPAREAASPPPRRRGSWPFPAVLVPHTSVTDLGVGVPARQEVEFKDGKRIWLGSVMENGVPHLYLRQLGVPAVGVVMDLRNFIADVEKELPTTSTRDVAGYVAISLRLRFPTLEDFLQAVSRYGVPQ